MPRPKNVPVFLGFPRQYIENSLAPDEWAGVPVITPEYLAYCEFVNSQIRCLPHSVKEGHLFNSEDLRKRAHENAELNKGIAILALSLELAMECPWCGDMTVPEVESIERFVNCQAGSLRPKYTCGFCNGSWIANPQTGDVHRLKLPERNWQK